MLFMKLLLHMCCGPCSCYPVKKLRAAGWEPTGYFFNPNIHPYKEWKMRLDTAREFAAKVGLEFLADETYRLRDFLRGALAAEGEAGAKAAHPVPAPALGHPGSSTGATGGRCRFCYSWRLEEAARFAAENGFEAFTSTLFYSIYQDHELMRTTATALAEKYGLKFYYEDFRIGWQEGIDISRELGLYRQPYCGCIFSEEERYNKALRKKKKKAGAPAGQENIIKTV